MDPGQRVYGRGDLEHALRVHVADEQFVAVAHAGRQDVEQVAGNRVRVVDQRPQRLLRHPQDFRLLVGDDVGRHQVAVDHRHLAGAFADTDDGRRLVVRIEQMNLQPAADQHVDTVVRRVAREQHLAGAERQPLAARQDALDLRARDIAKQP